jgi:pyridinium-3,5-biscarboxylic acid mononucleotide sulfurtransferase
MLAHDKFSALLETLRKENLIAIAFSGGIDSTLLLKAALDALGTRRVLAVTVVSPLLPTFDRKRSQMLTKHLGIRQVLVPCAVLQDQDVVRNDAQRCYYCKRLLFSKALAAARNHGIQCLHDGSNGDDDQDYRPGRRAAQELDIRSPLVEVGLTKQEIRHLAKILMLPNWNHPADSCLATRIVPGMPITLERLIQVEGCEAALRHGGFIGTRARHHGDLVRLEVSRRDFQRLLREPVRTALLAACKAAGFRFVTLDLDGYRMGSQNLPDPAPKDRDAGTEPFS